MKLKQYLNEKHKHGKGCFCDNGELPEEGQEVYGLVGFDRKLIKGKVVKQINKEASSPHPLDMPIKSKRDLYRFKYYRYLYTSGLDNNYVDIEDEVGKLHHVDINDVFDHEPHSKQTEDDMDFVEWY